MRRATHGSGPETCSARARSAPAASSSTATAGGCNGATSSSSKSKGSESSEIASSESDMCCTCDKVHRMTHIQIRNVPPELHRKLKVRAAEAGMSLSDYLLETVVRP